MNKNFIIISTLFFITLGVLLSLTEQGAGLRFFAENRTDLGDTFFKYATQMAEEPFFAILTILAIFVSYRLAIKIPLGGFAVMGLSYVLKAYFLHKRPSSYFKDLGTFDSFDLPEGIDIHQGLTSFPSGHTMGGFALFVIIALHYKKNKWVGIACAIGAILVGISRIYLFQHFMKDVLLGGIIGIAVGYLIHWIFSFRNDQPDFWLNKRFLRA